LALGDAVLFGLVQAAASPALKPILGAKVGQVVVLRQLAAGCAGHYSSTVCGKPLRQGAVGCQVGEAANGARQFWKLGLLSFWRVGLAAWMQQTD
jgi:hypothetical protein